MKNRRYQPDYTIHIFIEDTGDLDEMQRQAIIKSQELKLKIESLNKDLGIGINVRLNQVTENKFGEL